MLITRRSDSVSTCTFARVTSALHETQRLLSSLESSARYAHEHDVPLVPSYIDNQQQGWRLRYDSEPLRQIRVMFDLQDDAQQFATYLDNFDDFGPIDVTSVYDGRNTVVLCIGNEPSDWLVRTE